MATPWTCPACHKPITFDDDEPFVSRAPYHGPSCLCERGIQRVDQLTDKLVTPDSVGRRGTPND